MPWGFFIPYVPVAVQNRCSVGFARRGILLEEQDAKAERQRDAAREAYLSRRRDGEEVNLQRLAEELGVKYDTLRRWKSADKVG